MDSLSQSGIMELDDPGLAVTLAELDVPHVELGKPVIGVNGRVSARQSSLTRYWLDLDGETEMMATDVTERPIGETVSSSVRRSAMGAVGQLPTSEMVYEDVDLYAPHTAKITATWQNGNLVSIQAETSWGETTWPAAFTPSYVHRWYIGVVELCKKRWLADRDSHRDNGALSS